MSRGVARLAPQLAMLVFFGALGLLGGVASRVFEAGKPRVPALADAPLRLPALSTPRRPSADVEAAVENNPFSPLRRPPRRPFEVADAGPPGAGPVSEATPPPPALRLLGTMLLPGGRAVALLELGDAAPQLVHVGERIGGFELLSVDRRRAVFGSAAGPLTLEIATRGS